MQTSSRDGNHVKRLSLAAGFLCAALMLSLAESMLFPAGILPIPVAKAGLANAAVLLCSTVLGRKYAAAVSLCRVILTFFLFGTGTSFIYSVSGAVLSFIGIAAVCGSTRMSYLGKSVIAAVLHNMAQAACAFAFFGTAVLALIPYMVIVAVLCGTITGVLLNLSYNSVYRFFVRIYPNTNM